MAVAADNATVDYGDAREREADRITMLEIVS